MAIKDKTKKSLLRLILSVLLIGAFFAGIYLLLKAFGITELTREQIQDYISSLGAIAPIAFIFISFLQVTIVPIPSTATILAGTFLFGPIPSFFYSFIGIMLGAMLAFALGRLIGRPYINWIAGSREEADGWLARLKGREKVFLFFAFLFPLFPDDLLCSVAGMLSIKFSTFTIMQIITRITSIGATLLFMSGEVIPYEGFGLVAIIALILLAVAAFILSMIYAEKLNSMFDSLIKRVSGALHKNKDKNT